MFTAKPESGESVTKLVEGIGNAKTPLPEIFAPKSPRLRGKMVPSIIGEKSHMRGEIVAEEVVVRGRVVGSIKGLRITLQGPSHVEGDIFHQSLAIEQGAYFEGKSRRSDNPLGETKAEETSSKLPRSTKGSSSSEISQSIPAVAAE